ncbi:MAG: CDP-alcohol phosphatidyltransferase family protein [Planctomycetota bacterium]|nr:CDP-alcohol phosphatidyltransferase family protein [Planctomycetota bacterium]
MASTQSPNSELPAWKRDLPNALTIARVVLACGFVAILSVSPAGEGGVEPSDWDGRRPWLALGAAVFVVAAVTDALDGFFARRWGVISTFGRVMDPFADKLLVLGAFVCLCGASFFLDLNGAGLNGAGLGRVGLGEGMDAVSSGRSGVQLSGVQPWMVVVVLGRELLVTSIRGVYEARGRDFSASLSGKLKMIFQSVAIPLVLGGLAATPDPSESWIVQVAHWIMIATVVVTALSGVAYVRRAMATGTGS